MSLSQEPDSQNQQQRPNGNTRQIVSSQIIEQMSAMMHVGPGRDAFVDKMTPEHVTAVIANKDKDGDRHHREEMAHIANRKWFFVGGAISIVLVCFLFLNYNQTEHLDAVLGVIAGMAGGYGLGKASGVAKNEA